MELDETELDLIDAFAGLTMQSLVSEVFYYFQSDESFKTKQKTNTETPMEEVADAAYAQALAMIKVRKALLEDLKYY